MPWEHLLTGFFLISAVTSLWTDPHRALTYVTVAFIYLLSLDTLRLRRRVRDLEATLDELITGEPTDDPR